MIQKKILILVLLTLVVPVSAQSADPQGEPRIYELRSRAAMEVAEMLRGFVPEALIRVSESFNTVTITATAARHEIIKDLIRRFDVEPGQIEFQLYILKASSGGNGAPAGVPEDIAGIVREVRALTRYDHFELLDSPVLRTVVGHRGGELSGDGPFSYQLEIGRTSISGSGEDREIRVGAFQLEFRLLVGYRQGARFLEISEVTQDQRLAESVGPVYREAGLGTSFNVGNGEKIVLGASRVQGSEEQDGLAIITVVEARILN